MNTLMKLCKKLILLSSSTLMVFIMNGIMHAANTAPSAAATPATQDQATTDTLAAQAKAIEEIKSQIKMDTELRISLEARINAIETNLTTVSHDLVTLKTDLATKETEQKARWEARKEARAAKQAEKEAAREAKKEAKKSKRPQKKGAKKSKSKKNKHKNNPETSAAATENVVTQ